jgi:hypothetical protein
VPSVVIATAPFVKLLTVMLRARQAPDAQAVVIAGNPEYIDAEKIGTLADRVLAEIVRQLGGGQRADALISADDK